MRQNWKPSVNLNVKSNRFVCDQRSTEDHHHDTHGEAALILKMQS